MAKMVLNNLILVFIFMLLQAPSFVVAYQIMSGPSIITISAQVNPSGGDGGGGGGGGTNLPTTVNFSGMAYPNSKVVILNNGTIAATTVADPSARFSVSINNLATNTYNFSVYGEDINGIKSITFSFPVYVTSGTTINIGGIFLSPTVDVDKSEVKQGDPLLIFGQSIPNTSLDIIFHSDLAILKNTKTDDDGLYKYNMNTAPLVYGSHIVKSQTKVDEEVMAVSREVPFIVGLVSKLKDDTNICGTLRGDLNCDSKVNLVDFSIMAYWYKRINPPAKIDLNRDKKVTLVDFSIMAYNWTG